MTGETDKGRRTMEKDTKKWNKAETVRDVERGEEIRRGKQTGNRRG